MGELRRVEFVSSFPSRREMSSLWAYHLDLHDNTHSLRFLFLWRGPCSLSLFYIEKEIMNKK